jgi:DNA replication protein DnaC
MNTEKANAILPLMLKQLRLPTFKRLWRDLADQADREGWGSSRYLATLSEHELQARRTRTMTDRLRESCLDKGKTLSTFEFSHVPMIKKPYIETLSTGEVWLKQGANLLIFGPSGVGKTHLANAIGVELLERGTRVLFTRTTTLVQKLQSAKQSLSLPSALKKLDKYDCLILDDFGYVHRDSHETSVLFELISERYERKSIIITCNQAFDEWDKIFEDKVMAVAAIDRLVHNATILEINAESYRKNSALQRIQQTNKEREDKLVKNFS